MDNKEFIFTQLRKIVLDPMETAKDRLEAIKLLSQIEGLIPTEEMPEDNTSEFWK